MCEQYAFHQTTSTGLVSASILRDDSLCRGERAALRGLSFEVAEEGQ